MVLRSSNLTRQLLGVPRPTISPFPDAIFGMSFAAELAHPDAGAVKKGRQGQGGLGGIGHLRDYPVSNHST